MSNWFNLRAISDHVNNFSLFQMRCNIGQWRTGNTAHTCTDHNKNPHTLGIQKIKTQELWSIKKEIYFIHYRLQLRWKLVSNICNKFCMWRCPDTLRYSCYRPELRMSLLNPLRPSDAFMQNQCCNIVNKTLRNNFSEILIKIPIFSFKKMRLNVSSAKRRPFFFGSMC